MKILVVDDSIVFRTQITASLSVVPELEVVGSAPNGKIALQKLQQLSVDLITLDLEMPEMNGMDTLLELRKRGYKTKVIVFSSQTVRGAEKAMDALRAGADDVIAKPEGDSMNFEVVQNMIRNALLPRVLQFIHKTETTTTPQSVRPEAPKKAPPKQLVTGFLPNAVVIASSTGGPSALETIFSGIKGPFQKPLLIVQHMPPVFTQILAKRLAGITGVDFVEAKDGDPVIAGRAYIAPGDFHMKVETRDNRPVIALDRGPQRNSVRPAADYLFETASEIWKASLLGIVLTGMGEDGAQGAKQIRSKGGRILIQNRESCVVFGMPGVIYEREDYDEISDLEKIRYILKGALL